MVIVNSEIELQFIPPTTIQALPIPMNDLNPSKIHEGRFIITTKYGSGLWSESGNELTDLIRSPSHYSPPGMGPSLDWALHDV